MMNKCVIFDLDGTLANTLTTIAYYGNFAIGKLGYDPVDEELYKTFIGDGAKNLILRLMKYREIPENLYEQIRKIYDDAYDSDTAYLSNPYDGIMDMIAALKADGIKLAVLSNKPHSVTVSVVAKIFGSDNFDIILGQRDDYPKKPDPQVVYNILDELDIKKENCVFIGDTNVDIITANSAGISSIGVLWGFRDFAELNAQNPTVIISDSTKLYNTICEVLHD